MASQYIDLPVESGGGGITSINGDTTAAQVISGGTNITVSTSSGTTTVSNTVGPAITTSTATSLVERDSNGLIEDIDPSFTLWFYEDFLGYQPTNDGFWNFTTSGTGAHAGLQGGDALTDISHPGVVRLQPGTTSGGKAAFFSGQEFVWGAGAATWECLIYMPTLPDGVTDDLVLQFGFGNKFDASTPDTGLWFEWDPTVNSGNFRAAYGKGTATYINTTTTLAAATWTKLSIVVNAGATLATYYINGVSVATTNSHIPNSTASAVNIFCANVKSVGTTNLYCVVDYIKYKQIFTTPR